METYKYTAISKDGQKIHGVIDGYNELDAVDRIKKLYGIVVKVTPVGADQKSFLNVEIGGNKLNSKAFTLMCSQFAIILNAGIPVGRAVRLIADKTTDKILKRTLNQVAGDVEAGRSLATSFADRGGKLFPTTFIETIRAGEESGNLANSFESMHEHFDKTYKMKKKVKSALAYPAFVLVIAIAVVVVLMIVVVPTFTAIFDELGGELPGITKLLIAISEFFQNYIIHMVVVVIILFITYQFVNKTEKGRLKLSIWATRLPVFGNIVILNSASQFANSMHTMLASGMTMVRSLNITAKVISNYYISTEIGKIASKIEEGRALGVSLRETGIMPDILVDMTSVGEETGELEGTLKTIAGYYDTELDMALAAAVSKLEPALLVGLAGIAGFIVIAIYVSMFSMYNIMG